MRLIAPHILDRYEGDLGSPPAIKVAAVDLDVAYVRGLIRRYPSTPILLRFIDPEIDQAVSPGCAQSWVARRRDQMAALNAPNVLWEFLNEVNQSRAVDYARESTAWLDLMHGAGYRCAWPSLSTGTPATVDEGPTQRIYNPVLARLRPTDACSPHEYLGDNVDTAMPWHITRFTKWPELMQHDLYISETGSDANTPGGQAGWRNTFGGNLDAFLAQLRRLDEVYSQYPRVKAAHVFSIGQTQYGWDAYNLDWDRVTAQYGEGNMDKITLGPLFLRHAGFVVTREFGFADTYYADGWHKGTDFARAGSVGTEGAVLLAPMDCTVDGVWYEESRGWYVYLKAAGNWEYCAYHMMQEPALRPNQALKRGDVIGHLGKSGTKDAHLHCGVCAVLDAAGWPIDTTKGRTGWLDVMGTDVVREW